jgi:hypothetical protein
VTREEAAAKVRRVLADADASPFILMEATAEVSDDAGELPDGDADAAQDAVRTPTRRHSGHNFQM